VRQCGLSVAMKSPYIDTRQAMTACLLVKYSARLGKPFAEHRCDVDDRRFCLTRPLMFHRINVLTALIQNVFASCVAAVSPWLGAAPIPCHDATPTCRRSSVDSLTDEGLADAAAGATS